MFYSRLRFGSRIEEWSRRNGWRRVSSPMIPAWLGRPQPPTPHPSHTTTQTPMGPWTASGDLEATSTVTASQSHLDHSDTWIRRMYRCQEQPVRPVQLVQQAAGQIHGRGQHLLNNLDIKKCCSKNFIQKNYNNIKNSENKLYMINVKVCRNKYTYVYVKYELFNF